MAGMVEANEDLVFDVGLHRGEDTAFYLAKGFRVIAIEASPSLVADAKEKFRDSIAGGRLTIVNVAIAEMPGPIDFFANPISEWGTIRKEWANRNANLGSASSHVLTVTGVNFSSIIEEYGTPYYLKVDIEGADLLCLEALKKPRVPKYVSIESDMVSWQSLEHEFDVLKGLGYRRFKVVPQHQIHRQRPPRPQREGLYVPYHFHRVAGRMRVIVRKERPHTQAPRGGSPNSTDTGSLRSPPTRPLGGPGWQLPDLPLRHRRKDPPKDRIRVSKTTGRNIPPLQRFDQNQICVPLSSPWPCRSQRGCRCPHRTGSGYQLSQSPRQETPHP